MGRPLYEICGRREVGDHPASRAVVVVGAAHPGAARNPALPTIAHEPTSPAAVQPERGNEVPGTVVHGNTTIVFESAGTHGLDSNRLLKWDQFAEGHPKIATALAYNPSLINDSGYLSKTV
jgi:hypothetical protein